MKVRKNEGYVKLNMAQSSRNIDHILDCKIILRWLCSDGFAKRSMDRQNTPLDIGFIVYSEKSFTKHFTYPKAFHH